MAEVRIIAAGWSRTTLWLWIVTAGVVSEWAGKTVAGGRWPVAGEQVWKVTNETFQFSSDVSYYNGTRLERLNRTMITSEGNFVLIVL